MAEPLNKKEIKEALVEALEPFAGAIREDFDRVNERFDKLQSEVTVNRVNIQEGFREAKAERVEIKARVNATHNAVDGFVKVVDKLETEFTVMKEDIKRVKQALKEKLGVDLL